MTDKDIIELNELPEIVLEYEEEHLITFNYEGGFEEYEDSADMLRIKGIRGIIIA